MKRYDLVVIGSGPAGEKGAAQAAYFSKKVAVVEKEDALGGAAANTGTLPSKTLRETALYLSGFLQRDLYGVNLSLKDEVTVRDFMYRERLISDRERARVQENLRRHSVDVYRGKGAFAGPNTVVVKSSEAETSIQAEVVLIATGSRPFHPPGLPFDDPRVYDSDTILGLEQIPKRMLVVGGGVIGCEYSCTFTALGVQVEMVEGHDRLLPFLDHEVTDSLRERMGSMGVGLHLPDSLLSVDVTGEDVEVTLKSGKKLRVDTLLVTTGRMGNTQGMGLRKVEIDTDDRGRILVNEHYQTSLPHVYAAGDVIGFPALASTSMEQARVAMVHAFDLGYKTGLARVLPYGIYTIPECSMAGETEESLVSQQVPYVVGKASYGDNPRGLIVGEESGFLKLLFHQHDMRLLGVHVIGEMATEIVHVGLSALLMGAGVDLFIQTCYNYPTLTDLYKYAAYDALDRRAARERQSSDHAGPE